MALGEHEGRGTVLVVGTANVCRSAYVERRLAHLLAGTGVAVASAGVEADEGRTMDRAARARLERSGGSASGFVARQLTSGLVASADLVLTMTRLHRSEVAQLHYPAVGYAFTLGDFAGLVAGVELPAAADLAAGETWVAVVAEAAAGQRGLSTYRKRAQVDIVDTGHSSMRRMARHVESILPTVADALSPPALSWAQRATLGLAGPSR